MKDILDTRLKCSLLIGFVLSLGLEMLSAAATSLYPYRDHPEMPKTVFIYLLLPGWVIAELLSPRPWSNVVLAVVINSVFYGLVALGFFTIWKRIRHRRVPNDPN